MTDPIEALILFFMGWAGGVLTVCALHLLRKKPPRPNNVFPMDRIVVRKRTANGDVSPFEPRENDIPF